MSTVYMNKNSILSTVKSEDFHSKSIKQPFISDNKGNMNEMNFNDINDSSNVEKLIKSTVSGTFRMLTSSKSFTEEDKKEIKKLISAEFPKLIEKVNGKPPIYTVEMTNKMVQKMIMKYNESKRDN